MPENGRQSAQRRGLAILAAAVLGVALIGFATGISPEKYEPMRPPPLAERAVGDVPPARSHTELERHPWRADPEAAVWENSRSVARWAAVERWERGESVEAAVADRAERRAYAGAPPVVPHPVRPGGAPECVACHLEGFALAGRRASLIPHEVYASCTQCHVSSAPSLAGADPGPQVAANGWLGLASPTRGEIAYTGAPPAVPHSTWMRERCMSCHGPDGRAALRTPHAERQSCLQCHPAVSEHGPPGAR